MKIGRYEDYANGDDYRAARKALRAAHDTLDAVYAETRDMTPAETVAALVEKMGWYGAAVTVAEMINGVDASDGRISHVNREWSSGVMDAADYADMVHACIYHSNIHSCHKDQIANAMRAYKPAPREVMDAEPAREETASEPTEPTPAACDKVCISTRVSKLAPIPTVSLPPVVTCPRGVPCARKAGKGECGCYVLNYLASRPTVAASYNNNLRILRQNPTAYWLQVKASASASRFFRYHVSGDIPDAEYLRQMVKTAEELPETRFLCFTKAHALVNAFCDAGGVIPENLIIVFSAWGPEYRPDNPYHFPVAEVIFKGQVADPSWYACGGNCFNCACRGVGCWQLKRGETIAFKAHR